MKIFKDVESRLNNVKIKPLSSEEKGILWSKIEKGMAAPQKSPFFQRIASPFSALHFQKSFAFTMIALLLFSTSGVAFAYADSAKPGDVLFPLGVAKEKIVIFLSPTNTQNELRLKYAEKRIEQGNEFLTALNTKLITSTTTRTLADTIATGTPTTASSYHNNATTSPAVVSDAVNRLSATIAYLQGVKADLEKNGNLAASQTIQNAIDKILEQVTVAANQNAIVIAKVQEHKNQFNVVVSTKNASTTTTTNLALNTKKDTQKITITEKENGRVRTHEDSREKESVKKEEKKQDDDEHKNDKKYEKKNNRSDDEGDDEDNNNEHRGFFNWFGSDKKIDICHKGETISVSSSAKKAHLEHGDYTGECKTNTLPVVIDTLAPVVSGISTSLTPTTAKIAWDTNENATAILWYGTTTAFDSSVSLGTLAAHQEANFSSLLPDTTYSFAIVAKDASGNSSTSTTSTFKTSVLLDITAPTISDVVITHASEIATVLWKTNENATGKIYYGTVTPLILATAPNTKLDAGYSLNHSFNLTGLATSTTYYFVLEGKDAAGNTGTSTEHQFTTGA